MTAAANSNTAALRRGVVKSFGKLGYGFIGDATLDSAVFCHWSAIEAVDSQFRYLVAGQEVQYELAQGPRGLMATRVVVVKTQREVG